MMVIVQYNSILLKSLSDKFWEDLLLLRKKTESESVSFLNVYKCVVAVATKR